MHHCLELTPDGRLLARQQTETPEGLREKVTDFTAQAHHRLDDTVIIQAGTRLSAIFELLMANEALKEIYTRNWVHDYVARYEAIRSGEAVPTESEHADTKEPAMQALVLSQHQEVRLPQGLLARITAASEAPAESRRGLLNLLPGGGASKGDSVAYPQTVKESSSYWHLSGRSVPFTQDTELWGVKYKAGSHIDYSVSFSFDRCIDLPLSIGAGVFTTGASELARNAWVHGGGGEARVEEVADGLRRGVRLTFRDRGPGIADIERVLAGGFSTIRSLGLGLSGTRRLVDEFEIDSSPGRGTVVVVTKWTRF